MIRVVAVDNSFVMLKGLETIIGRQDDVRLIATADHGSKLPDLVWEYRPDVAIADLDLITKTRAFDPVASVRAARQQSPDTKILVYSDYMDGAWARALVEAGVSGYMLKYDPFCEQLGQVMHDLCQGGAYFSPEIAPLLIEDENEIKLTDDERSFLRSMIRMESTKAMMERLGLSEEDIQSLMASLLEKWGVDLSREPARLTTVIINAHKRGLLPGNTWTLLKIAHGISGS